MAMKSFDETMKTETQCAETKSKREDSTDDNKDQLAAQEKQPVTKIAFKCEYCKLRASCDYKGDRPPFAKNIRFDQECYVMKDPFSPPPGNISSKSNSEYFIVAGADCGECGEAVCASATCSLFYRKTFCIDCAYRSMERFPLEIQTKIRKTLVARNTES